MIGAGLLCNSCLVVFHIFFGSPADSLTFAVSASARDLLIKTRATDLACSNFSLSEDALVRRKCLSSRRHVRLAVRASSDNEPRSWAPVRFVLVRSGAQTSRTREISASNSSV